jgi:hypothetical protein
MLSRAILGREHLAQDHWRKVEKARQRLVLCRLMIDIMRTVHGAYQQVRGILNRATAELTLLDTFPD